MATHRSALLALALGIGTFLAGSKPVAAGQPYLGFDGTPVRLPTSLAPADLGVRGMRVVRVNRGSPAARMGLERGDIVVTIDGRGFKSRSGYLAALRMAGQKPSLIVINIRNGKLTRVTGSLPHKQERGSHPDVVRMAIDLRSDFERR